MNCFCIRELKCVDSVKGSPATKICIDITAGARKCQIYEMLPLGLVWAIIRAIGKHVGAWLNQLRLDRLVYKDCKLIYHETNLPGASKKRGELCIALRYLVLGMTLVNVDSVIRRHGVVCKTGLLGDDDEQVFSDKRVRSRKWRMSKNNLTRLTRIGFQLP